MQLQVMREHPSLARVPPFQPDLWGFSRCLCGVVHPSGMGGCGKGNPELFNLHFPPDPELPALQWGPILNRSCRSVLLGTGTVLPAIARAPSPCPRRSIGEGMGMRSGILV